MRYKKRSLALVLAMVMALGLGAPALAREETVRAVVTVEDGALPRLTELLEEMEGVYLLYRYERLFSGAAVEATEEALGDIAALPGVRAVEPTANHRLPQAAQTPLVESNSLDLMSGWRVDHSGDGIVIAVIDSGLRWTHEAFADHGLAKEPAISEEDVAAFVEAGGTPGRYISRRIPFAYDYCFDDDEVLSNDGHGTHVSALAAGCAKNADGSVKFRGVAPAAQLLAMKVFPDSGGRGADDADVLRAMEDAFALGADVINLSLGLDNGFVSGPGAQSAYAAAFGALAEAGVVVCCAAGNGGNALADQGTLPTADFTDYGTLAAPAVYEGATAVAAANARVYERAGYILAGGRQIGFFPAWSENALSLPGLETLAGRELTYVHVPGTGTKEDFAGVDVRGRVALVERGVISFHEKAGNAAAAGAAACLVYNNEEGITTPVVETDAIPCVLISREDGAYLISLSSRRMTVSADARLVEAEERTMQFASSWGASPDLRLRPTLTAPGGEILSASGSGDSLYQQLSGTSMAAPNAAGAFALVLQRLRQEGVTDKKEAADRAAALLESTAVPLTEDGVPLSPRRQGAGLVDLEAALTSGVYLADPLVELGEFAGDRFTLSFRVENTGAREETFTVEPAVLTDGARLLDGRWYSTMTARDITARCAVDGPERITVPAGGSREVRLTVTLSRGLLEELEDIFTNGFFVEGYVDLRGDGEKRLHAVFLGYRGDWEQAPVIEQADFRDALQAQQTLGTVEVGYAGLVSANMGVNMVWRSGYDLDTTALLGDNPLLLEDYDPRRAAISTPETDALYTEGQLFFVDLYTLRNAAHVIMVVSDSRTGEIYRVQDRAWLTRSGVDTLLLSVEGAARFQWNGTGAGGRPLPDGTRVDVEFFAWTEGDSAAQSVYESREPDPERPASYSWLTGGGFDRCREWSFSLTIDRSAPVVTAAAVGGVVLQVRDRQYLAQVTVRDSAGRVVAQEAFAPERAGLTQQVVVDAEETEVLYVTARDYAGNVTGCAVDVEKLLAGEPAAPTRCAAAVLEDVAVDAWYHEAVDRVWLEGVMECREGLAFAPESDATRMAVVTALYALAGSPQAKGESLPFADVNVAMAGYRAVQWAYREGIVQGFSDTTFGAYATVSRQQLATILRRFAAPEAAADAAALSAWPDGGDTASWAAEAVAWAVEEGYLSGYPDGRLAPRGQLSRAELAQILTRFMEDHQ